MEGIESLQDMQELVSTVCGKHAFKCSGHVTLKLKIIVFMYIFSLPLPYLVGEGFT